jgi:Zn2+/Cd2+-exporting ATPase
MSEKSKNHHHDECCHHDHKHNHGPSHAHNKLAPPQTMGQVQQNSQMTQFRVSGMDCADEIAAIQKSLSHPDIHQVTASLMSSMVTIHHDPKLSLDFLKQKVNAAGVRVVTESQAAAGSQDTRRIVLVAVSGFFAALSFGSDLFLSIKALSLVSGVLAVIAGGILIFPKAFRAFRHFELDMNVLMTVATIGALAIGEYAEAATVVFLFSLSELLEAFSVTRARKAIREVLELAPKMAHVLKADGRVVSVPVQEAKIGDTLLVKAGERIPLDGVVIEGHSLVNQAPLTGESIPAEKENGADVYAGTINETSVLKVKVTSAFENSKVSQIIRLIEEAQKKKAPSEKFVDKFARIYTPLVFVLAILTCLIPPLFFGMPWMDWIYRALVLLVIACPCALVISTPISIVSGLTAMARRGVLVKGGVFLEALGKIRAVAVDKTGTITEGHPKVQNVFSLKGMQEEKVLQIAASIEQLSSHHAFEQKIVLQAATHFKNIVGRGAEAEIDGHQYFLGNHRFVHDLGVCTPELEEHLIQLEKNALSIVVVGHRPHSACTGEVFGVVAVGDSIRSNASSAIKSLHQAGVESVVMLSGDNQKTASSIASQVGIDIVQGDLLPEDKVQAVKNMTLTYGNVAMIGDGINDAPALAQASVGIAMGAVGTDTALETADVALMKDDLSQVAMAIQLGRRTLGIIKFNITFALGLKLLFLVFAVLGHSNLWLAVAADTGATLLVIANSLRLLRVD